eukprot:768476-Hanusia_phi.AAC.10
MELGEEPILSCPSAAPNAVVLLPWCRTWGWKGGKVDSGVYDNDPDHHTWAPASAPVDPTQYQKEWLGNVVNIY